MEDLIGKYFLQVEDKNQLQLLGIKSIGAAVKAFIEKEDKDAISVIVENQVRPGTEFARQPHSCA
jgi:hypothetical protein